MPGAFLKGNSLFHGVRFEVDELNSPWNLYGTFDVQFMPETTAFISASTLQVDYLKLRNIVFLHFHGDIKPSTQPYTGSIGDTSYLYTGASVTFTDPMFNTLRVRLESTAAASSYHFSNTIDITDTKDDVYYTASKEPRTGIAEINGIVTGTELRLVTPFGGFLPNHTYSFNGTLCYETL